ncbi:transketolase family protein [Candidatus Desantisbacteria bacterium]|nr:transketolase family protein [Candidatus Desantisbacteria bacterium]
MAEAEMIATRDAYGNALIKLGKIYPDLVVLDADTSSSTRTQWFSQEFPERFFNLGISEANMIGYAAGLSTCGKIPVVSTFACFWSGRVYDQVKLSVCWPKLNVKIIVTHAGVSVGEDGASHQAIDDINLMRGLPNMTVIVPADGIETEKAVRYAIETHGPFYIRLGRLNLPLVFDDTYEFMLGKASTLREGVDATIIACGLMVNESIQAAQILSEQGVEVKILNASSIKPIDKQAIILAAKETGAIVTAEEHSIIGGLGSAVAEVLAEHIPTPMERVGVKDAFGQSGTPKELLRVFGLDAVSIVEAVIRVLGRKMNPHPVPLP